MPLLFSKTLDLKLLALVEENRVIYDPQHPKYLDLDSREVAWQRIGDSLRRPATVCKSRWINIRDMMRRKVRERRRRPHQRSYHYKYEDQMTFMLPFLGSTEDILEETPEDDGITEDRIIRRQDGPYPSDSLDVFLMSIGATLRKFSPYHLNLAKSKIFRVVQEFELRQIVDRASGDSGV